MNLTENSMQTLKNLFSSQQSIELFPKLIIYLGYNISLYKYRKTEYPVCYQVSKVCSTIEMAENRKTHRNKMTQY